MKKLLIAILTTATFSAVSFAATLDLSDARKSYLEKSLTTLKEANPDLIVIAPYVSCNSPSGSALFVPKPGVDQPYSGWANYMSQPAFERGEPQNNHKLLCFQAFRLTEAEDSLAAENLREFSIAFIAAKITELEGELTQFPTT